MTFTGMMNVSAAAMRKKDNAYRALTEIIKINSLTFIAGGADGPFNSWGVYKMIDNDGFPSYHIVAVVKNTYKEIKK